MIEKELSQRENEVLNLLVKEYPNIGSHIPKLFVCSREKTEVGMYVNFGYINYNDILPLEDGAISTNDILEDSNLENGLGYEVDITDGIINFIEFVTFGEEW